MPRLRFRRDSPISRLPTGEWTPLNRVTIVTVVPFGGGIAFAGPEIDKGDTIALAKLSTSSALTAFDSRRANG